MLAELSTLPGDGLTDGKQKQTFIDGFSRCAHILQLLGWRKNEYFFKRVKEELENSERGKDVINLPEDGVL